MRYWHRDFRLLACGVFGVGAFFGILYPLFNNFIVDQIGIQPHELGYMESLREVPGFLNALFTAVIIYLAPPIVAGLALVVMGIGMAAYSQVNSFYGILVFSFVWSIGFHAWLPLRSAMTLAYSADEEKGKWFGQLRSVESLATLAMIGLCLFATNLIEFEGLFQIGGCVVTAGGIALLFASRRLQTERENRFVLRKKYWLYYLLSLMDGSRRQIFTTFAIFALVKVFGTDRGVIIKLVLINQVVVLFFSPMIGRLVDKRGERTMLSISYAGLFFVFIGYALLRNVIHLYVLYCIDNFLFVGRIALMTYLNKIAPPQDLKPTLAMGVTMNHVAAVSVPLIGGLAWASFGYQIIFIGGAVFTLISLICTQWMKIGEGSGKMGRST
jgi:predicted MFS family arabinose efflux permease